MTTIIERFQNIGLELGDTIFTFNVSRSDHYYRVGSEFHTQYLNVGSRLKAYKVVKNGTTWHVYARRDSIKIKIPLGCIKIDSIVGLSNGSRDRLNKLIQKKTDDILKIQSSIDEINKKIEFMDMMKTDKFDEKEFKSYHLLQVIENNPSLSITERTAMLAELL